MYLKKKKKKAEGKGGHDIRKVDQKKEQVGIVLSRTLQSDGQKQSGCGGDECREKARLLVRAGKLVNAFLDGNDVAGRYAPPPLFHVLRHSRVEGRRESNITLMLSSRGGTLEPVKYQLPHLETGSFGLLIDSTDLFCFLFFFLLTEKEKERDRHRMDSSRNTARSRQIGFSPSLNCQQYHFCE